MKTSEDQEKQWREEFEALSKLEMIDFYLKRENGEYIHDTTHCAWIMFKAARKIDAERIEEQDKLLDKACEEIAGLRCAIDSYSGQQEIIKERDEMIRFLRSRHEQISNIQYEQKIAQLESELKQQKFNNKNNLSIDQATSDKIKHLESGYEGIKKNLEQLKKTELTEECAKALSRYPTALPYISELKEKIAQLEQELSYIRGSGNKTEVGLYPGVNNHHDA
jgi:hypothetical protein